MLVSNKSVFWISFVVLVAFFVLSPVLGAQSNPPQQRNNFVLNVYVDPIYGDDFLAATNNNTLPPLSYHPQSQTYQGVLYHAPYSFRTVGAAINWVKGLVNLGPFLNQSCIPLTNTTTNKVIYHVVIHCLPGIYGSGTIDPYSGLPTNGEAFPIQVPEGVSIQGTSALNTIFDAYDQNLSIFVLDGKDLLGNSITSGNPDTPIYKNVFIDGVTIRGARGSKGTGTIPMGAGIVIGVDAKRPLRPTISNCFIVNNSVGIAIGFNPDSQVVHSPKIVNNTIARNTIGVWNGGSFTSGTGPIMRPRCINNIFDGFIPSSQNRHLQTGPLGNQSKSSRKYYGRFAGQSMYSCFEGLGDEELIVYSVNGLAISINFNAYQVYFNQQTQAPFFNRGGSTLGWPAVQHRSYTTAPIFDIGNFGYYMDGGCLYVNDTFWFARGEIFWPPFKVSPDFDLSPHDFRLAPRARFREGTGGGANSPLIDRGLDLVSSNYPIQMGGGSPPIDNNDCCGLPENFMVNQAIDYSADDFDCEGFGNPRIFDYPGIDWGYGYTDIGADEVGNLVMAGYVNGTTIFSNVENDPGNLTYTPINNLRAFFLHLDTGNSHLRPQYNVWEGFRLDNGNQSYPHFYPSSWWQTARSRTPFWPGPAGSNYVYGEPGGNPQTKRYQWTSSGQEPAFPRNLTCDFSPFLMMDEHPWWSRAGNLPALNPNAPVGGAGRKGFGDSFSQNPWNNTGNNGLPSFLYNNPNLFYQPGVYDAVFGILNPPGTWHTSYNSYLDYYLATSLFGPFWNNPPGTTQYFVQNGFGIGDSQAGGPDYLPSTTFSDPNGGPFAAIGVRYNCEVQDLNNNHIVLSNLQSFLVVNLDIPGPIGGLDLNTENDKKVKSYLGTQLQYEKLKVDLIKLRMEERKNKPNYLKDHPRK